MQVSKLVDAEIKPKISVQETDVDAFYKENVEKFKRPRPCTPATS